MKKDAKVEYKIFFEKIRTVINRYDPENLDAGKNDGSPLDEYDAEVSQIVAFVIHNQENLKMNPKILSTEINRIWQEYFGRECSNVEIITQEIVAVSL